MTTSWRAAMAGDARKSASVLDPIARVSHTVRQSAVTPERRAGIDAPSAVRGDDPRIVETVAAAVERIAERLGGCEVACLLREGETLRHVAHRGRLPLIYAVPAALGGVAWRAARTAEAQVVPDVEQDREYLASDPSVRAEVAVPVVAEGAVVGVLDVEYVDGGPTDDDVAFLCAEAGRLALELGRS